MRAHPAQVGPLTRLACLVLATGPVACSNAPSGAGATPPPPVVSCDAGVPSYKTQIVSILQEDCIPCHSPSGNAGYDETSYPAVADQAGAMLTQVVQGGMPPLNGPQLTSAQRDALTAWLECGAPNN